MQVVGIGFIIGAVQDSCETALNSSDVLFTATAGTVSGASNAKEITFSADGSAKTNSARFDYRCNHEGPASPVQSGGGAACFQPDSRRTPGKPPPRARAYSARRAKSLPFFSISMSSRSAT